MYTTVAQRKDTLGATPTTGYVPVTQRMQQKTESPVAPFSFSSPHPEGIPSFLETSGSTTSQSTPLTHTGSTVQSFALDLGKSVGQATGKAILSSGIDLHNIKHPDNYIDKIDLTGGSFIQEFAKNITGQEEIKPLAEHYLELTPKIESWQSKLNTELQNKDLNPREKTVLKVLANLNPGTLAFAGVVGGAGLDLTPFGGPEKNLTKNLFKTIVKTSTLEEALILGRRMKVDESLLETFAHGVVKTGDMKQAEQFFDNFVEMQMKTEQGTSAKNVYTPITERIARETKALPTPEGLPEISTLKKTILLHGGPKELKGGKLDIGMGVRGDAGGIFFTPDTETGRMYARSYTLKGTIKTGEGKIHRVELSPSAKVFEASNAEHIKKLESLIGKQGVEDIVSTSRNGVMDWATGGQYFNDIEKAGFDGAKLSERPAGFDLFDESGKLAKTKEDAVSYVLFNNKKFEMLPDEALAKEIQPVDKFIAEGKIRVKRVGNRDVYEYKKGNSWQRARDEDSAVKAVTPVQKPINYALEEKKLELSIKKEVIQNHPARGLEKFVAKRGEFKGQLREVTGKGGKFSSRGDSMATERGFEDSEKAREALEDLKAKKEEIKALEQETKEMSKISPETSKEVRSPRLSKEEAQSLEEAGEQSLNTVDEAYRQKVLPLKKIISDYNTPVKVKVSALDYFRTPDRVLKKIGLEDVAQELRKSYDSYVKELPVHLQIVTDWSKAVPKESNVKIFKWLDGQNVALNAEEIKVAQEIKAYLEEWAFRLGLPDDNRITHYITHIFDFGVNEKEFDEDIARLIKDKVPGSVYDPFLERRLGKKGYIEDTWQALDAYIKRAVRKSNMDPALEQLERASAHLEDSQLNYVTRLGARINMRPTEWDNLLDNSIKQLVGYRFGQRPTAVITGTLRKMVYRGSLGLNISSAVKNLTQGVNTFAKLGTRDTLTGYINLLKPGVSKELEEVGVLRNGFIQDRTLSATRQLLQKTDKGLFIMFELAEKINRGAAYFGAKTSAIRKGLTEEQAIAFAKKTVRDTQFQFGAIDTPVAMQGDIAKTLFQFGSFSQKQTEFLLEMAKKKELAGIVRYIVASTAIVYTVGQVFNIKGKDFNPLNYFSRFGSPPSLALPTAVFRAVTNMPDQYGKTPTTKAKIKDIIYSSKTLIPAGVQLDKFLKGNILGTKKTPAKKKTTTKANVKTPAGLPKLPSLKKSLPTPKGLPKLPKR